MNIKTIARETRQHRAEIKHLYWFEVSFDFLGLREPSKHGHATPRRKRNINRAKRYRALEGLR